MRNRLTDKDIADLIASQPLDKIDTSHIRVESQDRYGNANLLSKLTWSWMEPLFFTGFKRRHLKHKDLYSTPSHAQSEGIQIKFQKYWEKELGRRLEGGHPKLWLAFIKLFWLKFLLIFIFSAIELVLQIAQALLVGLLADYFIGELNYENTRNAYLYAMCVAVCAFLLPFVHAHAFYQASELGMLGRIALTGAMYRKLFDLSQETISKVTIGKLVNLMSYDVQRLDVGFFFTSYIILAPCHTLVVLIIMWFYLELGPSALAGIGLVILLLPVQYLQGKLFAKIRFASVKHTDKRVRVMNEIISGIKVIKMYGWEYAFQKLIVGIRKKETRLILLASMIRAVNASLFFVSIGLINMLTFSTFTLTTGQPVTPSAAFSFLSLLTTLRITAFNFFIQGVLGMQELKVAFSRIRDLLLKDLPDPHKRRRYSRRPTVTSLLSYASNMNDANAIINNVGVIPEGETPSITVKGLSAAWNGALNKESGRLTLNGVSFSCDLSKRMLAIVGPVGAGKSSILHCLLGELLPLSGDVEIVGTLGYSSQDPWVFSGTVRDNVLFGCEFKEEWYQQVLTECCLSEDIEMFSHGDSTLVGERGVTLSGGQKARITLARAIYRRANVYILDDPLSAVDTVVGRRLFQTCMSGVLKNSIVVLVTHHLQYAQLADSMLVIDQGEPLADGTYDDIMSMIGRSAEDTKYARIKEVLSEMIANMNTKAEKEVFNIEDSLDDSPKEEPFTIRPGRGNLYQRPEDIAPLISAGTTSVVSSSSNVDVGDVRSDTGGDLGSLEYLHPTTSLINFPSVHNVTNFASLNNLSIIFTSEFDLTEIHHQNNLQVEDKPEQTNLSNVVPTEDKAQGSVSTKTYYHYFIAGGSYTGVLILLFFFIITEANILVSDWWLSEWAEANGSCADINSSNLLCNFSTELIIEIYVGIVGVSLVMSTVRAILFFYVCVHAAQVLHNRMFAAVLRAPMRFFDTNPIGRVLNRFSKDLGFLDDLLPYQFYDYLFIFLRCLSVLVISGIANYYIFIPIVLVLVVFLLLRAYYLTSAREIKRLEAIARSPLFSHITATLQGLTTIRVCERQDASMKYFHAYQDEQTKGWVTVLHAAKWFGLRIDLVSSVFITVVVFLAIPLVNSVDPGLIGLSLVYSISLADMCQYGMRMSTEVENLMISTERLLSYGKLAPEAPLETPLGVKKPDKTWPHYGSLHLQNLYFRYAEDVPYVLKDITVNIIPSEKVGVVGRTGAGKSSLLQALFRMAEPEGILEIDGVSITELGLHDLRTKISIIPQTIRREFSDCTTITIAHRLNTIMDSDRIMVLSAGKIHEFDAPYLLLSNPKSLLSRMVRQMGENEAEKLQRVAAEKYYRDGAIL